MIEKTLKNLLKMGEGMTTNEITEELQKENLSIKVGKKKKI